VRVLQLLSEDSSRKEVVSKKDQLLNKLLNKSTIITSFSAQPQDIPILEKFKEIARREAGPRGFSEVLLRALKEYNRRHDAGNPQLTLPPYMDEKVQNPMKVLCLYLDGAISDGRVHCKRACMWIPGIRCYSCDHNRLRKK
jgi:ribonuclease D